MKNRINFLVLLFTTLIIPDGEHHATADQSLAHGSTLALGDILETCESALSPGPVTLPEAPPEILPRPLPLPRETPRDPERRVAPHPFPNDPVRKPTPVIDPKDLLPVEFYTAHPQAGRLFNKFPTSLQDLMVQSAADEERKLKSRIKGNSHKALTEQIQMILRNLDQIEEVHKSEIEALILKWVTQAHGEAIASNLTIELSNTLPPYPSSQVAPPPPVGPDKLYRIFPDGSDTAMPRQTVIPIPYQIMDFFMYRRELYNLLAQAAGWNAMQHYAFEHAEELAKIDPRLPELYQTFYLQFRLLNHYTAQSIANLSAFDSPSVRERGSIGREIVTSQFDMTEEAGVKSLVLKDTRGLAVGINGLALIHETMKAAFQMASPLEASQRSVLTPREREKIDRITNSNSAEIRQAIFGPAVSDRILHSLDVIYGRGPHFKRIEQIFLLPEPIFNSVIELSSMAEIENHPDKERSLRAMLSDWVTD